MPGVFPYQLTAQGTPQPKQNHNMKDISQKMLCLFSALFITLFIHMPGSALAATINVVKPDELDEFMNYRQHSVFIDGKIDENTPKQLENVLKTLGNSQWVFINSPGGSLFGGMETGRVLRKYNSTTYVGEYRYTGKQKNGPRVYSVEPGKCESACAFAFLGGYFRYMSSRESRFGVHRFWSNTGSKPDDLDRGQIITTAIANYLSEMQIDAGMMSQMVSVGKDEMNYLTETIMEKLKIINNGRAQSKWTIDVHKELGAILTGHQDIATGQGLINIYCSAGMRVMGTTAWFGADTAQMIVDKKFLTNLMATETNSKGADILYRVQPTSFYFDGDMLKTAFFINSRLEQILDKIDAIGVGYVDPNKPGLYIGFVVDIGISENRTRIKNFLTSCK